MPPWETVAAWFFGILSTGTTSRITQNWWNASPASVIQRTWMEIGWQRSDVWSRNSGAVFKGSSEWRDHLGGGIHYNLGRTIQIYVVVSDSIWFDWDVNNATTRSRPAKQWMRTRDSQHRFLLSLSCYIGAVQHVRLGPGDSHLINRLITLGQAIILFAITANHLSLCLALRQSKPWILCVLMNRRMQCSVIKWLERAHLLLCAVDWTTKYRTILCKLLKISYCLAAMADWGGPMTPLLYVRSTRATKTLNGIFAKSKNGFLTTFIL